MTGTFVTKWKMPLLSVLRIVTGFLFVAHGTQKLFGLQGPMPTGAVPLQSLLGAAGVIELVAGGLLLIGLLTRPAAFILSGEMAFAYFMQHAPRGFWPLLNQGEIAVLYCFLFLYFSVAGPGPFSLDALVHRRHADVVPLPPEMHRPRAA